MHAGPQTADRLTLVSELTTTDGYALILDEPVFIPAGATYWTEGDDLCIEDAGEVRRCSGAWETRCYG